MKTIALRFLAVVAALAVGSIATIIAIRIMFKSSTQHYGLEQLLGLAWTYTPPATTTSVHDVSIITSAGGERVTVVRQTESFTVEPARAGEMWRKAVISSDGSTAFLVGSRTDPDSHRHTDLLLKIDLPDETKALSQLATEPLWDPQPEWPGSREYSQIFINDVHSSSPDGARLLISLTCHSQNSYVVLPCVYDVNTRVLAPVRP